MKPRLAGVETVAHDPTGQFAHNQRKTSANMANDCLRHAEMTPAAEPLRSRHSGMGATHADPESRTRVTCVWIPGSREGARPGMTDGDQAPRMSWVSRGLSTWANHSARLAARRRPR